MPEHYELKLIPLRRLANPHGYSAGYLSLLVQRHRLQAQKVGRNYFTTLKWFNCYLRKYAYDDMRRSYRDILPRIERDLREEEEMAPRHFFERPRPATNRKIKEFRLNYVLTAVLVTVVFVLSVFSVIWLFRPPEEKGQVAGVDESLLGSTTVEVIGER